MIFSKLIAPLTGTAIALAGVSLVERALPVTMMMDAVPVSYVSGDYTVRVTGYKVKECLTIPGTFVGWYKDGGIWHEAPFSFPNDLTPNDAKPKSYSPVSFGLFKWDGVPASADTVKMTVVHNCDGHPEMTTVGPWPIERIAE